MRLPVKLYCQEWLFNIVAALFFTLVLNAQFLLYAWQRIAFTTLHDYVFAASLPLVLAAAFCLIFNLAALPGIRKPLLVLLILTSAANYFTYSFGTVIDTNMIQNVFETNLQESVALLSLRYLLWMLLLGLIPTGYFSRYATFRVAHGGGVSLFAPSQPPPIPLLLWMSDDYAQTFYID